MASELFEMTAAELAEAYRAGEASPVDAAEALLTRIDALDATINAFCLVDHEASMAEAEASEKRWLDGAPLSPLTARRLVEAYTHTT